MSNQSIIRITKELSDLQKSTDLSLAAVCRDIDVRNVKAIIIGPPDTPYEFGFFEFAVKFTKEYPGKAPSVIGLTTNGGRCRFNPNIYANGKVCLSILGTWRGESGEQWSSAQGLESILISIQSLMSSNPYENEPGYETAREDSDKKNITDYISKIHHETLRISVIQRLEEYLGIGNDGTIRPKKPAFLEEWADGPKDSQLDDLAPPFEPFVDLCKRRFLWYYDSYLTAIQEAKGKTAEGQAFAGMPFESRENTMDGTFRYKELERRLIIIRKALDQETAGWAADGQIAVQKEAGIAANLQRQFEQVKAAFEANDRVTINLELEGNNPFVWKLSYFGRPMTNLDGGLLRLKICFSTQFPEELPRVKCETSMFHHRISKEGVVCYFPRRSDDVKSHIEGIVEALEEEDPPYDPRTMVNPEASKLYWGSVEDKKLYNRKLRRAVQRSMEEDF